MSDQGQNFISLGIDVTSFDATKEATIERFIKLFNKLDKYDGKSWNPVMGAGLTDFNASVSATSKLLDEMNTKLSELKTGLSSSSSSTTKAAAATKEFTAEQAKQKVETQEANRALLEYAKSQNASVQARLADKKAIADQAKAEADRQKQIKRDKQEEITLEKQLERSKKDAALASSQKAKADLDEAKATRILNNELEQLKMVQKQQAQDYANMFIAKGGVANNASKDPAVMTAFTELQRTSTVINDIEKNIDKATDGANKLGKGLTTAFSHLRTIAYILPGLGIAGIFNLAFEAIGKAVDELGLFTNAEEKVINKQIALNEYTKNYLKIIEDVNSALRTNLGFNQYQSNVISSNRAIGKSPLDILESEKKAMVFAKNSANADFFATEGFKNLDKLQNELVKAELELKSANQRVLESAQGQHMPDTYFGNRDEKEKLIQKAKQGQYDIALESYNKQKGINERNAIEVQQLADKEIEITQYKEEQKRKLHLETIKNEVASTKNKNEIILDEEIKSVKAKRDAIISNFNQSVRENNALKNYTLSRPDARNADGSLTTESNVVIQEATRKNIEAERKKNFEIYKLEEAARQERLSAQEKIDIASLNTTAITNEKITTNVEKSLEERIQALLKYVELKQQIEDVQAKRDLDKDEFKTGDATSKAKRDAVLAEAAERRISIQSDVEKKVFDIVYTSTQKELKLVTDTNRINEEASSRQYASELEKNNESFKAKKISYANYAKERNEINRKYGREFIESSIRDDESAIKRLQELLKKQISLLQVASDEVDVTKNNLNFAKDAGIGEADAQKAYDKAVGQYEGYKNSIKNIELKTKSETDNLESDKLKKAKLGYEQDLKNKQQYAQAIKQVEDSLYQTIKDIEDKKYQARAEKVKLANDIIQEQLDNEIGAVEKSSLTAKDKAALEIQLEAQKAERNKDAAAEERKIKRQQAVFDRDIGIAHILISTGIAVASLLKTPPLAIAAGVAGGAEAAKLASINIPAYEKGTKGKKHPGGLARTGEKGKPEVVYEPYKSPYLVFEDNISYLPKGTEVVPILDHPEFGKSKPFDNWDQTKWLAKQFEKSQKNTSVINRNIINIDLGFESYKKTILG